LFDFIGISVGDELLDVACGSGEFVIFCGQRIKHAWGVDISEKMIELAKKQAASAQLNNVGFECHDVEDLPLESGRFSVVVSWSSFHHMADRVKVFAEMVGCCRGGGLICLDDLAAYDHPQVNDFFDELDRTIDISHHARMPKDTFRDLFIQKGVEIIRADDLEFEIGVDVYASHAIQSEDAVMRIDELVERGLKDPDISEFLYMKDGRSVFKNRGYRVLGRKG
jgi:SAM-dependent methyltransferase